MSFARLDGTNRLLGGRVVAFDMRSPDRIYMRVPGRSTDGLPDSPLGSPVVQPVTTIRPDGAEPISRPAAKSKTAHDQAINNATVHNALARVVKPSARHADRHKDDN
jgi:cell division protein FtsQ